MFSRNHLSPVELATAIGASESSLKRWVDDEKLAASRTAGGHRRIPIAEAIRFIRDNNFEVVRPDMLGLVELSSETDSTQAEFNPTQQLFKALQKGDGRTVRGILMSLYLQGWRIAEICDGPIRNSLARLGAIWESTGQGIFIEHRAIDLFLTALNQLRLTITAPPNSLTAIGAACENDPYLLPTLACATALYGQGYRVVNLGPHTPRDELIVAAKAENAHLVWLSISVPLNQRDVIELIEPLAEDLEAINTQLIIGGRGLATHSLAFAPTVRHIHTIAELTDIAYTLAQSRIPKASKKTAS